MTTGPPRPLRVVIVARQAMARAGIRGILARRNDMLVAGQSATLGEMANLALDPPPDVVLAAWDPASAGEFATLDTIAPAGTPVVLLGDMPTPRDLQSLLRAGVRGFLLPDATPEDISAALHSAYQGLLVLDPALARTLATALPAESPDEGSGEETLTEREREVLELMALGLPNKTIANRLDISEHTVKFHVGSVLAKLGATSRTEAVTRAVRRGILAL